MNYILSIQDFVGKIKSSGWSAMRETVTNFVRHALETLISVEHKIRWHGKPTSAVSSEEAQQHFHAFCRKWRC